MGWHADGEQEQRETKMRFTLSIEHVFVIRGLTRRGQPQIGYFRSGEKFTYTAKQKKPRSNICRYDTSFRFAVSLSKFQIASEARTQLGLNNSITRRRWRALTLRIQLALRRTPVISMLLSLIILSQSNSTVNITLSLLIIILPKKKERETTIF